MAPPYGNDHILRRPCVTRFEAWGSGHMSITSAASGRHRLRLRELIFGTFRWTRHATWDEEGGHAERYSKGPYVMSSSTLFVYVPCLQSSPPLSVGAKPPSMSANSLPPATTIR